jgi:putative Holliday junction resolvase
MQRGRRIAFDYGDVRIGVAVSDPDAILASPLKTLVATDKNLAHELSEIFTEFEPVCIYVGKPTHMDGRDSESSVKAHDFAELIKSLTPCPVELIDERLSTVSATKSMRESGVKDKDARQRIDQAAAVAILEFALELEKKRS